MTFKTRFPILKLNFWKLNYSYENYRNVCSYPMNLDLSIKMSFSLYIGQKSLLKRKLFHLTKPTAKHEISILQDTNVGSEPSMF